jgi:tRNA (cmo5U34)-methyltransferase
MKDRIFNVKLAENKAFEFDSKVATVFDDMISRSVPMYDEVQLASTELVKAVYQPDTKIYDLGCSTGTTILSIKKSLPEAQIVGVDSSPEMLSKCQEKLAEYNNIELICSDITTTKIVNASVVILNYTLQFVSPEQRLKLLQQIYRSLTPGGALILTEKVVLSSPPMQKIFTYLHHDLKRRNGYSELEISQKRDALENVLVPLTERQNHQLLLEAGFKEVETYLRWINFVTILAVAEAPVMVAD